LFRNRVEAYRVDTANPGSLNQLPVCTAKIVALFHNELPASGYGCLTAPEANLTAEGSSSARHYASSAAEACLPPASAAGRRFSRWWAISRRGVVSIESATTSVTIDEMR